MIKAIIFDLDNTLIDRQKAFSEMLSFNFHKWFEDELLIQQMIKDMIEFDNNGHCDRVISFQKWIDKYHIDFISAQEFADKWKNESGTTVYLFDDVKDTLKELKKKYKIFILTNGKPITQRRKIDNCHFDDLIDYSLVASEFGTSKPDKAIFEHVCEVNNLKPEECIYVGDSYLIDVVGARNANMYPIYISRFNEIHDDVITIYHIKDVLKVVKDIA